MEGSSRYGHMLACSGRQARAESSAVRFHRIVARRSCSLAAWVAPRRGHDEHQEEYSAAKMTMAAVSSARCFVRETDIASRCLREEGSRESRCRIG